jgi:hypothetical protein
LANTGGKGPVFALRASIYVFQATTDKTPDKQRTEGGGRKAGIRKQERGKRADWPEVRGSVFAFQATPDKQRTEGGGRKSAQPLVAEASGLIKSVHDAICGNNAMDKSIILKN